MLSVIKLIKNSKNFSLKVEGLSMMPLLHPADVLNLQKTTFKSTKVNDIILVHKKRKNFIHRVIYKTSKLLVTKGDNNSESDGYINNKQIVAKAVSFKRNGKTFQIDDIYLIQSSQYFREILRVKKALEREKIEFLFLKGLPLHLYFEKTHPRRIYADCDLLVENQNVKIEKTLLKLGYRKLKTELSPLHKLLKNKETEISFAKKLGGINVYFDVHFEPVFMINQLCSLDALYPESFMKQMTHDFLKEKRVINLQGYKFPILSNSDLIIYLALHIFHHKYNGIHRLEFLNKIINYCHLKTNEPLRDEIIEKISGYEVKNFVYPVFYFLCKYYSNDFLSDLNNEIQPNRQKLDYLRKHVLYTNIFNSEERINEGITKFKNLFHLSPTPFYKRLSVLLNPSVIYTVLWVLYFKLIRFWKLSFWKGG